jgi:hypothetical protein
MDGSTPTTASTLYAGPVSIATTTTLSAIGVIAGGMSAVTSGTYTIVPPPPSTPVFAPPAGIYNSAQSVSITSTGATSIYYTTDGSTPTAASTLYVGPVSIATTTTLSAIGVNTGGSSPVASGTYTILPSTPVFAPAAGTYNAAQSVSITSTGATSIYYTTDGSTPTTASTLYAGPVSIATTTTLNAIGVNASGSSPVASGTYTILPSAPVFAPAAGTYSSAQSVSITCAGATSIYYTTDGSTPTTASTLYAGPVAIATTTTLRAIGANASGSGPVTSGTYTILPPPPAAPVLTPPAGTYSTAQSVSITSTGATSIYYTTDGSTPTTASTLYTGPVSIASTTTLSAIGVNAGGSSPVTSGTYTILPPPPAAPAFAPPAGTYSTAQSVSITSTGATSIYYTTDGSTPTTASTLYTGPVSIASTTTLSAIGVNAGGSSPVTSGTYTILPPPPAAPAFTPPPGTYSGIQSVSIASTGATGIYYTTDGSTPTTASTLYAGPVSIGMTTTLKAIGVNAGGSSPVTSGTYTIQVLPQIFTYDAAGRLTSAAQTDGFIINYSLDEEANLLSVSTAPTH